MSRREKLIERFKTKPTDFTYDQLVTLLGYFGYVETNLGNTSGSAVAFYRERDKHYIRLHKPHPQNIIKWYKIKEIYDTLVTNGDL